jgi:vacuolar protein sorting-associated protein 35
MDLKVTVGENVVRLSRLEGVNLELYTTVVLPALIKLVRIKLAKC